MAKPVIAGRRIFGDLCVLNHQLHRSIECTRERVSSRVLPHAPAVEEEKE